MISSGFAGRLVTVVVVLLSASCAVSEVPGIDSAALRSHYRAEAMSASFAGTGSRTCSYPEFSLLDLVEDAFSKARAAGQPLKSEFVTRVRLAAGEGALGLVGLSDRTFFPDGRYPCIRGFRIDSRRGVSLLAVQLDRRGQGIDVVAQSRCLFKDIELGFEYRIERVEPDTDSLGGCRVESGQGLCRPACAGL